MFTHSPRYVSGFAVGHYNIMSVFQGVRSWLGGKWPQEGYVCSAGLALSWRGYVWEPGMVLRKRTTPGTVFLEPLPQHTGAAVWSSGEQAPGSVHGLVRCFL